LRVPLSWIREFAPIPGTTGEIADVLNGLGLIVDGIDEPGREIGGVIVARVLDVRAHPDADKLTLVDVDTGDAQTTVVCGARNLGAGDVVPYAPAGATLPGGFTLERRKIRGVISDGMLCSARELGLGDDRGSIDAGGILHLDPASALGDDVRTVLGLDDAVFDLDITPNRPDAMSVVGVARDLAAAYKVPLAVPEPEVREGPTKVGELTSLVVEAPTACPRYVARVGTVRTDRSPAWLARRLLQAGVRPISNVVDVTNYVMLERGQPLHAFDLSRLGGRGIVVRTARVEETITTLDGVERRLTDADLLICDADRTPHAVAGVMGGAAAEVSDTTTEVLLESAYFTPLGIGRTSKRLGLRTESSARFERGVDPNGAALAADRAWELFALVAGGEAAAGTLDAYPVPIDPARVTVRTTRVNALLGTAITTDEITGYLEPLGLATAPVTDVGDRDSLVVEVPTYRPDIEREIDVVEEVARHHGYNRIERRVARSVRGGALSGVQRERRLVRDTLVGAGLSEAWTLSLVGAADLTRAGLDPVGVEIENPLRAEERLLRPALLPGLLGAAAFNADHGIADVALFEVGHVFLPPTPATGVLPDERDHVAVVITGADPRRPHEPDRGVDAFDATAVWEAVAGALALADARLEPAVAPTFHPTRTAAIVVDGNVVGHVGEIAPEVLDAYGLTSGAVGLEAHLDAVLGSRRRERTYVAPSRFPASTFDLAFVLPDAVPSARVAERMEAVAGAWVENVRAFDVFRSESVGDGARSVAYSIRLRASDRTLTDDDVATVRRACIDAIVEEFSAQLRG